MILVDSSVWIAWFGKTPTRHTEVLDRLLESEQVAVGDLMLVEVLRGCASEADAARTRRALATRTIVRVADETIAVEAARNYRLLRSRGITVRSTIDTLIATRCIVDGLRLLHADRDYLPFERHLGLQAVPVPAVS